MKNIKLVMLIFLTALMSGCNDAGLFIVNTLARFGSYTAYIDIEYGNKKNQALDIYIPKDISVLDKKSRDTVIFFYGGCWGACSNLNKQDYRFIAQTLSVNNIITVIVDYRKFPAVRFPDIIRDVASAVEWVSNNIESYAGNASNIFLVGHSAGAHLASMLTFDKSYLTKNTYENIKGFIGLAGAYDFLPFDEPYQPELFSPPADYPKSQPVNFVTGNEPPALLLYGKNDTRVKPQNILGLVRAINNKKGSVEARYYKDIDHIGIISALSIPFRSSKPVLNDILKFMSQK